MREIDLRFPSGELSLEGVLGLPEGEGPFPGVVICHPHPHYGGSMENNVVLAIFRALREGLMAAFRFNFRGVGRSEGKFGHGVGEQEDLMSALALLSEREEIDPQRVGLCGYSFGGGVAFSVAAKDSRAQALAAISPVIDFTPEMKDYVKSKFFLCGSRDDVISALEFQGLLEELLEPKRFEIVSGADHFWQGHEEPMAQRVTAFFREVLRWEKPEGAPFAR